MFSEVHKEIGRKSRKKRDELKLTLEKFQNSSKSLNNLLESQVCNKFKTGLGYNTPSPAVESFVNSSIILEYQENNKSKSDKGYHAVPPPYIGNFIPSKPDLMFMDEIVESENMDVITVVTPSNVKKVESNHESADVKNNGDAVEPKTVRKNSFRPLVIEDWNSDDDSKEEFIPTVEDKTVRPSTEKIKFVKSARETIEKVIRPVWNNSSRVNHKNFANKMTHPHPNRRFVPQAVLTRSGKINTAGASVNTAVRPVNTAGSKPTVNHPRPISNAYKKGYSQVTRPFNKDRAVVSEKKDLKTILQKVIICCFGEILSSSTPQLLMDGTFDQLKHVIRAQLTSHHSRKCLQKIVNWKLETEAESTMHLSFSSLSITRIKEKKCLDTSS
ncbi:hypothetical protein Tco_0732275 [Tanacetum coccineum]